MGGREGWKGRPVEGKRGLEGGRTEHRRGRKEGREEGVKESIGRGREGVCHAL